MSPLQLLVHVCIVSLATKSYVSGSVLKDLTDDEIEIIKDTWEIVRKNVEENAVDFLCGFIVKFPVYFPELDDFPLDELREDPDFVYIAMKLVALLDSSIKSVGKEGIRMDVQGLEDIYNYASGDIVSYILEYLEKELGEILTPKVRNIWERAFIVTAAD